VFAAFGLQGFNLREDGYLLTLGERMARGDVPYRDFSYIRPPLPIVIQAVLIETVPRYGVAASRWYFALQGAVILGVVHALLGRLMASSGSRAALAFLATLIACTGGFPAMPWHTMDGVFFATLHTWALVTGAERRSLGRVFVAGLLVGAAVLSKQGFLVVGATGLVLCWWGGGGRIGRRAWTAALSYAAGAGLIGGIAVVWLFACGALRASAEAILLAPRELTRDDLQRSIFDLVVGAHLPGLRGAAFGLLLVALVTLRMPTLARLGLGAVGLLWALASLWIGSSIAQIYRTLVVEPVHAVVWLGALALLARQAIDRGRLAPSVTWGVGLGLATLYAAGWSYEAVRSAVLALALPLPLVVMALAAAGAGGGDPRIPRFAAGCILVYAGAFSLGLHIAVPYLDGPRGDLTVPFATERLRGIRSSPIRVRGVDGVVALVRRETAPDDYILTFMDFPSLYFLADRRNPTRIDWFLSQELTLAERDGAMADLHARPPRLVVLAAFDPLNMVANPRLKPVLGHVLAHYERAEAIAEFLVFRPRRAPL
jgi:hypothetical protein